MRGRWALLGVVGVLVAVVAAFALFTGNEAGTLGAQHPSPPVRVSSADAQEWTLLTPSDGRDRVGWPRPMLARGDDVCFGFENPVFTDEARPSLSRCVDRDDVPSLAPDEIVVLTSIEAGLDMWHVTMFAAPVIDVDVRLGSGDDVSADRIHVDDDIVVLRLDRRVPLDELSWLAGRDDARCEPSPGAVDAGTFCEPVQPAE